MQKVSHVLVMLLMVQLISSCCDSDTEITVTGIETRALTLDGNVFVEINDQDAIDQEDLILEVLFNTTEGMASCDCPRKQKVMVAAVVPSCDPIAVYTQRIEQITVSLLDLDQNDAVVDITDRLVIQGTEESMLDFINDNTTSIENLIVELSDISNLPNLVSYEVAVTLDDGLELYSAGGPINFN